MATTVRIAPSAYTRSSSSRVTVTNPNNMYYNTDHTANYCSIRGRNSSSNTYYCFIHGFDFGTTNVPANANVTSFEVKIRCYRNQYQQTGSSYNLRLASSPSSGSVITGTTADTAIGITASVITIPTGNLTWDNLKSYGTNFSIDIILRPSSSQYPYVYVYGAEVAVTYDDGGGSTDAIYFKQNGSWVKATTVYKKVNGIWTQQSDLTNVFNSQTNYIKG